MHAQFLGHPSNRAYAELVLSTDLLKQLHFGSPVQRVSSASGFARIRVPVRSQGGPKQNAELGQIRIPKSRYAQTRGAEILTAQPLGWGNIERFLRLGFGCDDDQRGCFAVNSMRELTSLPTEAQEIISSSQQKLTRLLIKNIEAEEPKLDASMIADVVLTFFHGFCIAQNLKSGKASSERKIRNLMQVVRNL